MTRSIRRTARFALALVFASVCTAAFAGTPPATTRLKEREQDRDKERQAQPNQRLTKSPRPIVGRAVGFVESEPLRNFPADTGPTVDPAFKYRTEEDQENREVNDLNTEGTGVAPDPNAKGEPDGALQTAVPASRLTPLPSLQFEGLSAADNTTAFGTTVAPPDPNGAVGPNDYVQVTNNLVRIYDKNGVPRGPGFKLSGLFAALGGVVAANDQGDTICLYDRMTNRWLISQFAFASQTAPPYHMAIAISKNSDPTGAYWVYDFITPGAEFPDYFKFGAWPDAYYMTDRQFTNGGPFNSFGCFAFDKAKMIVGDPTATFVYFNLGTPVPLLSNASSGMLPTDFNGLTPPPAGSPNVFAVYTDNIFGDASDAVRLFNFHVDFATPLSSTFLERADSPLLVASFDSRNPNGRADIEEPPPAIATDSLDSLGDRLLTRLQYLNRGGTESFLLCHTVNGGTIPGTPVLPTRAQYRAATRYYELRRTTPGGTFTIPEQATFAPADTTERWMGSVAMDNAGDIAVGYSTSSVTLFPSIAWAGRLAGDPPNGLAQGEATMFTGTGVQRVTSNRWGDYSAIQLDPADDATFWYVNQYYAASPTTGFDWHTRIGRFKFAGIAAPAQGTLSGTITACDTGLPIADALVQVAGGPSTGFSSGTKADGTYSMKLSPGSYQVTIGDPAHNCNAIGPFTVTIADGGTSVQNGCLTGIPKFAYISSTVSGGNGDASIDKNECVTLNASIKNIGCLIASNVTAQLSTSTPNVTITQPNTTYPTMLEDVTGASQVGFSVSTSPAFVCGTTINFTLTIASPLGGGIALPFSIVSCQAPTATITGALTTGDLLQQLRLGRNGIASSCGTNKASPGTLGAGTHLYDLYTFVNGPTAACVKIGLTPACSSATNAIISVAYLNSFDPNNILTNYRGDPGGSPNTGTANFFSVDVPAGATLLVNVHAVPDGAVQCTEGYTLTVSGLVGNTDAGAVCVPCSVSPASNVTTPNDANQCGAVVSFASPTTAGTCGLLSCTPASGSFFPVGTTNVTCSTTAGPSTTFTVTVNDTQAPTITCGSNITVSNDANQCGAVVSYAAPAVSDNCPGVTAPICTPASGSFFPKGTTMVSCSVMDAAANPANCAFSVTVNDTQAPAIACPANIVAPATTTQGTTLGALVPFAAPAASDNCPGLGAPSCVPASGSFFPVGTTTVNCSVTDASSNVSTCSFTVTVGTAFNTCFVDDATGDSLSIVTDSTSPLYRLWQFRRASTGATLQGSAEFINYVPGHLLVAYDHDGRVYRMDLNVNFGSGTATATIKTLSTGLTFTLRDRNIANDPPCQ